MKSREVDDAGDQVPSQRKGKNQNSIPRFHLEKLSEQWLHLLRMWRSAEAQVCGLVRGWDRIYICSDEKASSSSPVKVQVKVISTPQEFTSYLRRQHTSTIQSYPLWEQGLKPVAKVNAVYSKNCLELYSAQPETLKGPHIYKSHLTVHSRIHTH